MPCVLSSLFLFMFMTECSVPSAVALQLMACFKVRTAITAGTHVTSFLDLAGWSKIGKDRTGGPAVVAVLKELLRAFPGGNGEVISMSALRAPVSYCICVYVLCCLTILLVRNGGERMR